MAIRITPAVLEELTSAASKATGRDMTPKVEIYVPRPGRVGSLAYGAAGLYLSERLRLAQATTPTSAKAGLSKAVSGLPWYVLTASEHALADHYAACVRLEDAYRAYRGRDGRPAHKPAAPFPPMEGTTASRQLMAYLAGIADRQNGDPRLDKVQGWTRKDRETFIQAGALCSQRFTDGTHAHHTA